MSSRSHPVFKRLFSGDGVGMRLAWGLGLIVLAARFATFEYAGSPLPFYDQWLLEFNNIYLKIQAGGSWLGILFKNHNEHCLATTRLLSLIGYGINGYWDVTFLVVAAALVRMCGAVLAFRLLAPDLGRTGQWMLFIICAAVFAAPVSGYNLLNGMQVSFFIVDLLAFYSIHTVVRWHVNEGAAPKLAAAACIGMISFGTAIAIPAATLVTHLVQRRNRPGFWAAWTTSTIVAVGAASYFALEGHVPGPHAAVIDRLTFLLRLASWPVMSSALGALVIAGLIFWILRRFQGKSPVSNGLACATGITVFAGMNAMMIAANRLPSDLHMRHWDTLALGTLGIAALLIGLADAAARLRRMKLILAGMLVSAYLAGLWVQIATVTLPYLAQAHQQRQEKVAFYRNLMLNGGLKETGDRLNQLLQVRDYSFFDDPLGRYVPDPAAIHNMLRDMPAALSVLAPEVIPGKQKSIASRATDAIIAGFWVPCLFGLAFIACAVVSRPKSASRGVDLPANALSPDSRTR